MSVPLLLGTRCSPSFAFVPACLDQNLTTQKARVARRSTGQDAAHNGNARRLSCKQPGQRGSFMAIKTIATNYCASCDGAGTRGKGSLIGDLLVHIAVSP